MNALKSLFTLALIVSCSYFGTANPFNNVVDDATTMVVETSSNTANSVDLRVVGNTPSKLSVHLKDAAGKVLYFDKSKEEKVYFKRFSLKNLADGTYYFSINRSGSENIFRTIFVKDGTIQSSAKKELVVLKALPKTLQTKIQVTDNQSIIINCNNKTASTSAVRLVDTNGKIWYFTKIKSGAAYYKKLLLKDLPKGEYRIESDGTVIGDFTVEEYGITLYDIFPRV